MTIQAITDRLAEEAGWKWQDDEAFGPWWWRGTQTRRRHPFRPDSVDDAIRGVPEGWAWQVGCSQAGFDAWLCNPNPLTEYVGCSNDQASHAVYFAIAKARGWM
jgi:hypothetical protein